MKGTHEQLMNAINDMYEGDPDQVLDTEAGQGQTKTVTVWAGDAVAQVPVEHTFEVPENTSPRLILRFADAHVAEDETGEGETLYNALITEFAPGLWEMSGEWGRGQNALLAFSEMDPEEAKDHVVRWLALYNEGLLGH